MFSSNKTDKDILDTLSYISGLTSYKLLAFLVLLYMYYPVILYLLYYSPWIWSCYMFFTSVKGAVNTVRDTDVMRYLGKVYEFCDFFRYT